jgi:adenylate cyclase
LRPRGGHVLKFIGDAMLATISFDEGDEKAVCRRALDAAVEASAKLKIRNLEREAADLPFADVDIALHEIIVRPERADRTASSRCHAKSASGL